MTGKLHILKKRVEWEIDTFARNQPILRHRRMEKVVHARDEVGRSVENFQEVLPAQRAVSLDATENDIKFLDICKYVGSGFYTRPAAFTCEVPNAWLKVGNGLICTPDLEIIADSQMEYRLEHVKEYRGFKPKAADMILTSPHGALYTTIHNIFSWQWQHWTTDCLSRIGVLSRAYPDQRIIVIAKKTLKPDFLESLRCALPDNFEITQLPDEAWVRLDRIVLPSYVTARANQHLPPGFYDVMRQRTYDRLNLPPNPEPQERIYISRALAPHRRVLNEPDVVKMLERYGFRSLLPEKLPFREQVDLFRRTAIIAAGYGSNFGSNMYAGKIKNLVFYGDRPPEPHVFTYTKALGQEHYFTAGHEKWVHSDFTVDLTEAERVLVDEVGLKPV